VLLAVLRGFLRRARPQIAIATAVVVALAGCTLLGSRPTLTLLQDDAYFYFQIARNVGRGLGFTFDGVHKTNGFQPLWQLLLVPIFRFLPGDFPPLYAALLLEVVLVASAAVGIYEILRARVGAAPACVASLLLVAQPSAGIALRSGMEAGLVVLILVVIWGKWVALRSSETSGLTRWFGLGAWCSVGFLARLDSLVALPVLLWLGRGELRRAPRKAVALVAPCLTTVVLYASVNRAFFGLWFPISGLVKSWWLRDAGLWERFRRVLDIPWVGQWAVARLFGEVTLGESPPAATLAYLALLMGLCATAWLHRDWLKHAVTRGRAAFPLAVGPLMLMAESLTTGDVTGWHQAPLLLATSVLGGLLASRGRRLAQLGVVAAAVVVLLRVPRDFVRMRDVELAQPVVAFDAARWIDLNLPSHARVGCYYGSGEIGYFAHGRVIDLDGLVNDLDFFRRAYQAGDLAGYLSEETVTWIVDPLKVDGPIEKPYWLDAPFWTNARSVARQLTVVARFPPSGTERSAKTVVWRVGS
jgi:hypothetical protein